MIQRKAKSLGEKLVWQLVKARWEPLELSLPRNNPIIRELQAMLDERKPLLDQMGPIERPPSFSMERQGQNKVEYSYTMKFSYYPGEHPCPYLTELVLKIGGKEERHTITDMRKLPSFLEARDRLLAKLNRQKNKERKIETDNQKGLTP